MEEHISEMSENLPDSDIPWWDNHYDKEFGVGHYPVELRMHFNTETLKNVDSR